MTASFCDYTSTFKGLSVRDYEKEFKALQKENFNLKLRIYYMEERLLKKGDDSTDEPAERSSQSVSSRGSSDFEMLDLLAEECQKKDTLINKLKKQLAEWEDLHGKKCAPSEVDRSSVCSRSTDRVPNTVSHLEPGHRLWADRSGHHILGFTEDYSALRRLISQGHQLAHSMDTQLQECLRTIKQQSADNKVTEEQHVRSLSSSINTMEQVFQEAHRLVKLVWRVSLPAGISAGESGNNQQNELLKSETVRLKSRLSKTERTLSEAVKRLRTTNKLKEGLIDLMSLTDGVMKEA